MKKVAMLASLFLLISAINVFAINASRTINYQGRLTDNSNNPVPDGNYVITFRFYDDPNAAVVNAKWSETQTSVLTKIGYFNVVLGGLTPFYKSGLDFNNQYWLGVQVGADSEMSPRQALNGVPLTLNYDLPIGSIMAWHKNMPSSGMPSLSAQWVECNGQVLNDTESIFNGQIIPNLNGYSGGASLPVEGNSTTIAAVFLRGGTTSGVGQLDKVGPHSHTYTYSVAQGANPDYAQPAPPSGFEFFWQNYPQSGTTSKNGSDIETRPVNMSVVWIMKIK